MLRVTASESDLLDDGRIFIELNYDQLLFIFKGSIEAMT